MCEICHNSHVTVVPPNHPQPKASCNCAHKHCGADAHHENKKPMDSAKEAPVRKDVVAKLTEAYAPIVKEAMNSFSKALVDKMGKGEIPAVEITENESGDTIIRVFSMK